MDVNGPLPASRISTHPRWSNDATESTWRRNLWIPTDSARQLSTVPRCGWHDNTWLPLGEESCARWQMGEWDQEGADMVWQHLTSARKCMWPTATQQEKILSVYIEVFLMVGYSRTDMQSGSHWICAKDMLLFAIDRKRPKTIQDPGLVVAGMSQFISVSYPKIIQKSENHPN